MVGRASGAQNITCSEEDRAGSAAKAEAPTLSEHRAHVGVET
jgi:hypothetical protein